MNRLIPILLLMILVGSCKVSEPRAMKQVMRADKLYGEAVGKWLRDKYPCIPATPDSSDYLAQKAANDQLIERLKNSQAYWDQVIKKLRALQVDSIAAVNCGDLLEQVMDHVDSLETINQAQATAIAQLQDQKPGVVKEYRVDSSYNREARGKVDAANIERDKWIAKAQAAEERNKVLEKERKGGFWFPWWLAIVLAVLITGGGVTWLILKIKKP